MNISSKNVFPVWHFCDTHYANMTTLELLIDEMLLRFICKSTKCKNFESYCWARVLA